MESDFEKLWKEIREETKETAFAPMESVFKALIRAAWERGRRDLRVQIRGYAEQVLDLPDSAINGLLHTLGRSDEEDLRG